MVNGGLKVNDKKVLPQFASSFTISYLYCVTCQTHCFFSMNEELEGLKQENNKGVE